MTDPEISIVLPIFNEAEVVERSVAEVVELMSETGRSFEIVCVDDGSTDDTPTLLAAMSVADPRLVPVRFSRNFGKEAALAAGLEVGRGRAVEQAHQPEDAQFKFAFVPLLIYCHHTPGMSALLPISE